MAQGDICFYCEESGDCRPYGPGGSQVCITCVNGNPGLNQLASEAFLAQLDAAAAMSGGFAVIMDNGNGPIPLRPEDLDEILPA